MLTEGVGTAALRAAFWQIPIDALFSSLGSGPNGLSQSEAERRRDIFGPNQPEASQNRSILHKIAQRVSNPLVAMLLVAGVVSAASGDVGSFGIIAAVLSLSLTLDIVQEHRAERTARALRESVAIRADAIRGGAQVSIFVAELVPGDVVKLRSGDLVPADGIVI